MRFLPPCHFQSQLQSSLDWHLLWEHLPSPPPQLHVCQTAQPTASSHPQLLFFKLPGGAPGQETIVISWNIEGLHHGFPSLVSFCSKAKPSLVFLSEPQAFSCNVGIFMAQLPTYKFFLNGEDCYLPDLTLQSIRAKGGTMALWESSLDPHITILPSSSASVLPLILDIPGFSPTAHIGIYLPKRSLEQEWIITMGFLSLAVKDILSSHPGIPIYIRGDINTNPNHPTRPAVLREFLDRY